MTRKRLLIIGAEGQLGKEFVDHSSTAKHEVIAPAEKDCDMTDVATIEAFIRDHSVDVLINCAAYNAVDDAEDKLDLAYSINADSVKQIAEVCDRMGCRMVHYSSDYVFDGKKQDLYTESDDTNPINVYGKSKLAGEQAVLETSHDFLVFRLSWVIGRGTQNFLHKFGNWAENNRVLKISADEVSIPTFTFDIAELTLQSLQKGLEGLYHMTSSGYASRYELARFYAEQMALKNVIVPVPMSCFQTRASRPLFSVMSNRKLSQALGVTIPSWKDSLKRFISPSPPSRS